MVELTITDASFRFSTEEGTDDKGLVQQVLKDEVVIVSFAPCVLTREEFGVILARAKGWNITLEAAQKTQ